MERHDSADLMYAGKTFDWPLIRQLYESGIQPAAIVRQLDPAPTRQAIAAKAKRQGWSKSLQAVVKATPDQLPEALHQDFGKDTPAIRAQVLDAISKGASKTIAAQLVGVHRNTLARWAESDSAFGAAIAASRARFLCRHVGNIDKAGDRDWRASSYLLERQNETREQFDTTRTGEGGIQIVLNIVRDVEGPDPVEREAILGEATEV